ncbi:MAG: SBBP repeat-containing protein, partial [Acidobacteriaceae bacterium]
MRFSIAARLFVPFALAPQKPNARSFIRLATACAAGALCVATAGAQVAAHFSYSQSIIGTHVTGPLSEALDADGNVYIGDSGNGGQVLKETLQADGSYVESTVATGFNSPNGVAVDSSGNVYVGSCSNDTLFKETLSGGTYTQSIAVHDQTKLYCPSGMVFDSSGNLFIADPDSQRITEL